MLPEMLRSGWRVGYVCAIGRQTDDLRWGGGRMECGRSTGRRQRSQLSVIGFALIHEAESHSGGVEEVGMALDGQ